MLAEAVHLAHGDHAAQALIALGARNVLVRRDLLTVGPCHADPAEHRRLRREFWGGEASGALPGVDRDEDLKRHLTGAPVVVWASGAWSDLTYLWALVDALVRIGVERPWLVRPSADDPTVTTGGIPHDRLRAAFEKRDLLRDDIGRSCLQFWNAYTDPSPLGFDELRRRTVALAPAQEKIFAGHLWWFPYRDGRPADADAAILRGEINPVMSWIGDGCYEKRRAELQSGTPPWWIGGCRIQDSQWLRDGDRIVRG